MDILSRLRRVAPSIPVNAKFAAGDRVVFSPLAQEMRGWGARKGQRTDSLVHAVKRYAGDGTSDIVLDNGSRWAEKWFHPAPTIPGSLPRRA
jgi:hypothetical protein